MGAASFPLRRHELVAVFAGGAIGTLLRFALAEGWSVEAGSWPWATLIVNIAGAALLGFVATHAGHPSVSWTFRHPLIGPGFCGALTTFSTMQLELLQMLDAGRIGSALLYVAVSVGAGLAAVAGGVATSRALIAESR